MSSTFRPLGPSELLPRYIFAEGLYAGRRRGPRQRCTGAAARWDRVGEMWSSWVHADAASIALLLCSGGNRASASAMATPFGCITVQAALLTSSLPQNRIHALAQKIGDPLAGPRPRRRGCVSSFPTQRAHLQRPGGRREPRGDEGTDAALWHRAIPAGGSGPTGSLCADSLGWHQRGQPVRGAIYGARRAGPGDVRSSEQDGESEGELGRYQGP